MKKKRAIALATILLIATMAVVYICADSNNEIYGYSQEYIAGTGNIKGDVDTEYFLSIADEFEIGANQSGYAVFKDPDKALEKLKLDYGDGIELIRIEVGLDPLSEKNYDIYGTYGWQVTTGTDEEQEQALFVSGFMDIYENSFKDQAY